MEIFYAIIGDIFGFFADILESLNMFQFIIGILLVGGFVYFMLAEFWWKEEPAPVPAPSPEPAPLGDEEPEQDSKQATDPDNTPKSASKKKGGAK